MEDEHYIRHTFRLALKGSGYASPNPLVGAVIVKNGEIIGRGYHRRFGMAHAEVEALRNCKSSPKGATLYVNLEPCSHYGKTPPCTLAVIQSGITRVVISNEDPNPIVSGRGVRMLRKAGLDVVLGVCRNEGAELNRFFFSYISTGKPYVTLKAAQTIDGRIADTQGNSKWITGEASRTYVHGLRAQYDAVLTGIGTVLTDNPALTTRMVKGRNPLRIILDSKLRIPLSAEVFMTEPEKTMVICLAGADGKKADAIRQSGARVIQIKKKQRAMPLDSVLKLLGKLGIASVLVEGGSQVFTSFLKQGLFNELVVCTAPVLIGDGKPAFTGSGLVLPDALRLTLHRSFQRGDDTITTYRRK